jgi:hypothetical protein
MGLIQSPVVPSGADACANWVFLHESVCVCVCARVCASVRAGVSKECAAVEVLRAATHLSVPELARLKPWMLRVFTYIVGTRGAQCSPTGA